MDKASTSLPDLPTGETMPPKPLIASVSWATLVGDTKTFEETSARSSTFFQAPETKIPTNINKLYWNVCFFYWS